MKILFLVLFALFVNVPSTTLAIHFTGMSKVKGNLYLRIKNEDQKVVVEKVIAVTAQKMLVQLPDLKLGKYAVSVFQDVNSNGKIDIGMFGPTEPYGYSNNARNTFSEPDFKDQLFELKANQQLHIHLK